MSDNQKQKIAIGFDLGTTSVGWSVIKINSKEIDNDNLEILDMGVRLFDDPASSEVTTETRRIARGRRRRINRQKIRKYELFKLLKKYELISSDNEFKEYITQSVFDSSQDRWLMPLDIKIKGLTEQLSMQEIVLILHNYIKHRGILNTIEIDDEEDEKEKNKLVQSYDKNKFPCENQLEWFKSTGKVLGNKENSIILNEQFKKEIDFILGRQDLIKDKKFIDDFIALFERHRHYSEGPGSEKSPTPYGRWWINEKTNKLEFKGENLWDSLIGKCTYYPNEPRNYKKSPITEYFNLLNDFANMKIKIENDENRDESIELGERYLSPEEKNQILSKATYNDLTLDKLLKKKELSKKNIIGGLKKDSNDKFVIEELKSIKKISAWVIGNNLKKSLNFSSIADIKYIDDIFCCGVKKQNKEDRFNNFKENIQVFQNDNVSDEAIKKLCEEKIWSTGTSSLSSKAQLEFIDYSLNDKESIGKNQMFYFEQLRENSEVSKEKFAKFKYFPEGVFKDEIIPNTVRRTFNQAIKVLNEILRSKKYRHYEISHLFIELAREMNSADEAQKITRELNRNKKYLDEKMKEHNISEDDLKRGENRLKFLLWCEQNKCDLYDGEPINLKDMLSNPNSFHIDHILPISSSLNDSMANKVVTKAVNNENKKDQTPHQWLDKQGKYEAYKSRCLRLVEHIEEKNKKMKSRMKNKIDNYLLYKKNLDDELQGFVQRQLNDSRYVSVLFSNQLKAFFRNSECWKDKKIVISPINGVLTTFARKNWFNESEFDTKLLWKNRDIYSHHAIDASIIAFLGLNSNIQKLLSFKRKTIKYDKENKRYIDLITGEILYNKCDFFKTQSQTSSSFRNQMRSFLDKNVESNHIKFSRMIQTKSNLPLSKETIYSLREYDGRKYKISKINLLESKVEDLKKYFPNESVEPKKDRSSKVICYSLDKALYEELKKIFWDYYQNDKINPFNLYLNSEFVKDVLKENKIDISKMDKIPLINKDKKMHKWVRSIRIKENQIEDVEEIMKLKGHCNNAFYDSLNFFEVRVYRNKQNKYKCIFISALFLTSKNGKMVIDEDKLSEYLIKNDIDPKSKFIEVKKGKTLIFNDDIYYFNGGGHRKQNKLEISIVSMKNEIAHEFSNWKEAPDRKQWHISVSTIAQKFKLCKVDSLGNVYDIQTFDEYFENDMLKY